MDLCDKQSRSSNAELDDPARIGEIRQTIKRKPGLYEFYRAVYRQYAEVLTRCPSNGIALEIGSGGGFLKEVIPGVITSDIIPYPDVDMVVDATVMPFAENSLRAILMLNVFHHIPDVSAFFAEAQRCLLPGGRILIVDQYFGVFSTPLLRLFHHEPCRPYARDWKFNSTGPLSGANGALAWIVFDRDKERFASSFPMLKVVSQRPHTPLLYWLSGGLKKWSLVPRSAVAFATLVDTLLIRLSSRFGSFVDIEIMRIPEQTCETSLT